MSIDAAATQAAVYSAPEAQASQAAEEQAVQAEDREPSAQAYTTTAPLNAYQGTTVDVYA
ncbi:MAG: hypothetical protein ACLFP4_17110 [Spirochaetales bacterium]